MNYMFIRTPLIIIILKRKYSAQCVCCGPMAVKAYDVADVDADS